MDENAIKAAALARIRRRMAGRTLPVVTSEFSLNGTGIRADLAVLDGDRFLGVEIKSEADTLKRLPSQLTGYAQYFDETVVILASRHLRALRGIDLQGAEVWRQEVLTDWTLHAKGHARRASGHWLLHLLTADEQRRACDEVERRGCSAADLDEARRQAFATAFRRRYAATSDAFWDQVARRRITPDDVRSLSRFHAGRERRRDLEVERSRRMRDWVATIAAEAG